MAEFKLGRIKFVYQGAWTNANSQTYVVDDVVTVGGKTYICVLSHTPTAGSAGFATDLAANPTNWNLVADGAKWTGTWANSTYYNVSDQVQYGGVVYQCLTAHTSTGTTASITATGLTLNAGTATLTYATQPVQPFLIGATITLAGFSPASTSGSINTVNTTFTVVTCSTTQLTFALTGTYTVSTLGTVSGTSQLGLEADQAKWTAFASNLNWIGAWGTATRYKVRDLVTYGGYTYVCNTAHVSANSATLGLENDISKWDTFNAGIVYRSLWSGSSVRYKLNDVVTYGADLWICTTQHTSTGTTLDASKFSIFVSGFEFQNSYNSANTYVVGDLVTYGGNTYTCILNNSSVSPQTPSTAVDYWQPFTSGFTFIGDWNSSTAYKIGSVVRLGAFSYVATVDISAGAGYTPPNTLYWQQLNSGTKWNTTTQTYTNLSGTNITGSGTGATFDVVRTNTLYTATVHSGSAGSSYAASNTIKILGTSLGGLSPVNDLTITVAGVTGGAITSITVSGISVTWASTTAYLAGDVTFWGASSFICVLAHVASSGNRPDNDLSGTYWNLLASGTEQAVLTTQGDMFYYSGSGPARLPIGQDGQVLRVSNNAPAWQYFGQINNLVYVAPTGVDTIANSQGTTIDKPWASIRYACQQIEDGYLNTNAKTLLTINKQFMMKETNNYVKYNYSFNITATTVSTDGTRPNQLTVGSGTYQATTVNMYTGMPISFASTFANIQAGTTYYVLDIADSTHFRITAQSGSSTPFALTTTTTTVVGSYVYDTSKTERDAGLIIEGAIFDLSHGGTFQTTNNTQAYFNSAGTAFATGVNSYDVTPFVASLNYLKSYLFTAVLGNVAPGTNYQTLNSASPTANQQINSSYTAETSATTTLASLISIITNAMSAGTTASTPISIKPQATISVKTGTFNEILPINVPAFTAIVGDELRSTVVQPAAADVTLATVVPKQQAALTRIRSLIPNLMSNTTISATTGNTTAQVKSLPAGSTGSTTAVNNLQTSFTILYSLVSNGMSVEPGIVRPLPTGFNTATLTNTAYGSTNGVSNAAGDTTGFNDAIKQIQQNYAFIIADTLQYLINNPGTSGYTGQASRAGLGYRDISYILDSIVYDMTYGGNLQSNVSGSSYYSLFLLQIGSAEKAAFVNALNLKLKVIISQICTKTNVSAAAGNSLTQNISGTAGSANAGAFAQDRVTNVVNWINNGTGDTAINPYIGWVASDLSVAYTTLTSAVTNIASDANVWCQKYYQNVNYSTSLTIRDAGLIINSLAYDMIFGTNFNAVQAGRAFNRANTSATTLRTGPELPQTLGAINFLYYKAKQIAASGATVQIQANIDDLSNFLTGGPAPLAITWAQQALPQVTYTGVTAASVTGGGDGTAAFTITRVSNNNGYYTFVIVPTTAGTGYTTSSKLRIYGDNIGGQRSTNDIVLNVTQVSSGGVVAVTYSDASATVALLQANRAFLLSEVVAYINTNYSSITSNPQYTVAKTQRDMGYILDAIQYDMTYGGNWASQNAGMAYYSNLYGTQITSGFTSAFVAAIGYISTTAQSVIQGSTVASPLGTVAQVLPATSQPIGSSRDAGRIGTSITLVTNFVSNGLTSGAPTITITTITGTNTLATATAHGLNAGDIVIPQTTSNGLTSTVIGYGTVYYVLSSGLTSTNFQLSTGYNGTAITSLTNGASLTIAAQVFNMPYLGWISTTNLAVYTAVTNAIPTYQTSVVTYLNTNYSALNYAQAYAQRDVNNVTLASVLDLILGSNFATIQAGRAYNRTQDYQVLGYEKTATIASLNYLATLIAGTLSSASYTSQLATAQKNVASVISYIQTASVASTPEVNGTITYNNTLGIIQGAEILRANIPFLQSEVVAYYNASYGGALSGIAASGNVITVGANHNLSVNDPVVFTATSVTTTATAIATTSIASAAYGTLTTSSTSGSFTIGTPQSAGTFVVGQSITISGTQSPAATIVGYTTGTTYLISATNGTSTFTITTVTGAAVTTVNSQAITGLTLSLSSVTVGTTTGMIAGETVVFASNLGNILAGVTYYVLSAANGLMNLSSSQANYTSGILFAVGSTASGSASLTTTQSITSIGGITLGTTYYVLTVPSNTTITITSSEGYLNTNAGTTYPVVQTSDVTKLAITLSYSFDANLAKSDFGYYLNAIVYDLMYTGNYRTLRTAQVKLNAVNGSANSNMWLVRNGCGIRNMTMNGLSGYLSNINSYGSKRPAGGAYTSLDPGFGPNDSNAWVYSRSTYVQNCTIFGYAVYGAKVDGALHAGGNRSMVANDYTCIIGDGIGWMTTGSGSLSELVSVFNYYSYAGYMADLGGRIRATNGNSSYGTYGVVAEGVDTFETPGFSTVNNRYFQAQITNTVTDGTNNILRLEFQNTGTNYTNSVTTISGSGYNAVAVQDEFRDSSIAETRIIDTGTTSNSLVGGTSYVTASNVAQNGGTGYITIAATDTALTGAYNNMRIQTTVGTGVGQYANILAFANGSKVANVVKDSFAPLIVTATANSNSLLTVASTIGLYTGMPVYFATAIDNITVSTVYYVNSANFSATQFQVSLTPGGAGGAQALSGTTLTTVTVTATATTNNLITATNTLTAGKAITFSSSFNGIDSGTTYFVLGLNLSSSSFAVSTYPNGPVVTITATGSASSTGTVGTAMFAAGWDHVIPGNAIVNALDLTTGYIIEPRISYSAPGYTATARTLPSSNTWAGVAYGAGNYVAVSTGNTATAYSTDGKTWTTGGVLPSSTTWGPVVYGGGQGAVATVILGGLGGSGAVLTATIGAAGTASANQVIGVTVVSGGYNYTSNPTIVFSSATGSGAQATCTVLNGAITSVTVTVAGSSYSIAPTVTAATGVVSSVTMTKWGQNYSGSAPTLTAKFDQPQGLTPTAYPVGATATQGVYYQVSASGRIYLCTVTGTTSATLPTFDYTAATQTVANGTATFQYIATQAQATTNLTNGGVSSLTISNYGYGYTSTPTVTILDGAAKFVTVSSSTTAVAYSTVAGLPSTGWSSSTSDSGSSKSYTALAYGSGAYVTVGGASGTGTVASSTDGVSWTSRSPNPSSISGSGYYTGVAYGGLRFVAVATSGVTTYSINNGASWVAGGTIPGSVTSWTGISYGNGRFVAVSNTNSVAYSTDGGLTWLLSASGMPYTQNWTNISYGAGQFIATATMPSPTITATTTGTNLVTLSSTAGLTVGNSIVPTSVTETTTATATATSTATTYSNAKVAGTILTAPTLTGTFANGMVISGSGVSGTPYITGSNTFTSTGSSIASTTLTIGTLTGGTVAVGQAVTVTGFSSTNGMILPYGTLGLNGTITGTPFVGEMINGTGITANTTWINSISLPTASSGAIAPGTTVTFVGSITGNTLTVTGAPNGSGLQPGMIITNGTGLVAGTFIVSNLTGTPTSASSTWSVSVSGSVTSITTAAPIVLTISGTITNFFGPGTIIAGGSTSAGTMVTAQITASAAAAASSAFASGGASGTYSLVVSSGTGFTSGQLITGTGIFANTFVSGVTTNTISLSQPLYAQASGTYSVYASGIAGTYNVTPSQTVSTTAMTGTTYGVNTNSLVVQTATITGSMAAYISANLVGAGSGSTWTITNFSGTTTLAATAIGGISYNLSTTQTVSATTLTGTNNLITVGSVVGMTVGEPIVFTAVTQTPTVTATSSTGNLVTVSTTTGLSVGEPIVFTAVTQTGTASATTTSTNLITLGSSAGIVAGETIVFTAVTQTPTLTATTTGTSSFTGYVTSGTGATGSGNVLTVMFAPSVSLVNGAVLTPSFTAGTYITTQLTATNTAAASPTSATGSGVSTITVSSGTSIVVGQLVGGTGIPNGTYVGAGSTINAGSSSTILLVTVANVAVLTTAPLGTVNFYAAGQQGTYTVSVAQATGSNGAPISGTATWNVITLSSNANIIVGESFQVGTNVGNLLSASTYYVTGVIGSTVIKVGATYGATTDFTLTNTTSQSVATTAGAVFGGLTATSQTYYVLTNVSNQITVSTSYGGSAVALQNSASAWTFVAGAAFGGLTATSQTYYITSIPTPGVSGTITVSTSFGGSNATLTNGNGAWTSVAGAYFGGVASTTSYFITEIIGNTVSVSITYGGSNLALQNSSGSWSVVAGAILGGLQSGNTYYIASISSPNITVTTSYANAIANTNIVNLVSDTGAWTSTTGTILAATSWDGLNWTSRTMPSSFSWGKTAFGNVTSTTLGALPLYVTLPATNPSTSAISIRTGATPLGRTKVASGAFTEIRFIEPGSGFPKGNVSATTSSGNLITVDDTTNLLTTLANNQPVEFTGLDSYGLTSNITYYVVGSSVTSTQFSVVATPGSTTLVSLTTGATLAGTYRAGPKVTIIDPNHVIDVGVRVRLADGTLSNPSITNRGSLNATATSSTLGDGYSDLYQNSQYINVSGLYSVPSAGSNVQFASITGSAQWYKLVTVINVLGNPGNYTAQFTINPALTTLLAPVHGTQITTRLKYSQVRLTGHDFLYIGTGNQQQTNYPYVNASNAVQSQQQLQTGGGRVFFTSTDQDGNFNVGNLFGVQQSTGTATLNASAFNLAGLQSLTLGAVTLGIGSATITQFSVDPFFTANSDNILPTQKAVKAYITAQIGGGQSTLNVNTITAGSIKIAGNTIFNKDGGSILVSSKMNFTGGIDGAPVSLAFFMQK